MATQAPWLVHEVPTPPYRQGFGFGFELALDDVDGMRRAGTGSWSGVLNTHFWIDRRSGIAAALLTQLQPLFDPALVDLLMAFEREVYA